MPALRTLPKKFKYVHEPSIGMSFACSPADSSEIYGSIKHVGPMVYESFCRRINGDRLLKVCPSLPSARRFIRQNAEIEVCP